MGTLTIPYRPFVIAQRSKAGANLFAEEFRLFPCGEVTALREPVVMDQFGICALRPAPRRGIEFVREDAHRHRDRDALDVEKTVSPKLPIETTARDRRVRQPGDRDVVEDIISR